MVPSGCALFYKLAEICSNVCIHANLIYYRLQNLDGERSTSRACQRTDWAEISWNEENTTFQQDYRSIATYSSLAAEPDLQILI